MPAGARQEERAAARFRNSQHSCHYGSVGWYGRMSGTVPQFAGVGVMKKLYFRVMYVLLAVGALVIAGGAPIPWSGTGGGTSTVVEALRLLIP